MKYEISKKDLKKNNVEFRFKYKERIKNIQSLVYEL